MDEIIIKKINEYINKISKNTYLGSIQYTGLIEDYLFEVDTNIYNIYRRYLQVKYSVVNNFKISKMTECQNYLKKLQDYKINEFEVNILDFITDEEYEDDTEYVLELIDAKNIDEIYSDNNVGFKLNVKIEDYLPYIYLYKMYKDGIIDKEIYKVYKNKLAKYIEIKNMLTNKVLNDEYISNFDEYKITLINLEEDLTKLGLFNYKLSKQYFIDKKLEKLDKNKTLKKNI